VLAVVDELNLRCKESPNGRGWVKCDKEDPEAREDLNILGVIGKWDREKKRFVIE